MNGTAAQSKSLKRSKNDEKGKDRGEERLEMAMQKEKGFLPSGRYSWE